MQIVEHFFSLLTLRSQRLFTLSLAEGCVRFFFLRKIEYSPKTRISCAMLKKFFGVLLLILSSALASQAQQSPVTVIRAGRLIDVDAGRALSNQTIVIRNGKIESLGENLAIPAGAMIIHLSTMTVR